MIRVVGALLIVLSASAVAFAVVREPRTVGAVTEVSLKDLEGRPVRPLRAAPGVVATVVVFASIDCPISNRYAPVVERLHARFASEGVRFYLVYPNPAESASSIRTHVAEYSYTIPALVDPTHVFVKATEVSVTPEAVVFDATGTMVYRGRIDNRFVRLGVERPAPTTHDLADAVAATLAGKAIREPRTHAFGCFVSDFLP